MPVIKSHLLRSLAALLLVPFFLPNANAGGEIIWTDLAGQLRRASQTTAPPASRQQVTAGGDQRIAIFQHAAAPGQPASEVRFPAYALPPISEQVEFIRLRTSIGLKDGDAFVDASSDGCLFIVKANGIELFRRDYASQAWSDIDIDLSSFAGEKIQLTLRVEPKKHSAADWAAWATPAIVVTGDIDHLNEVQKTGTNLPEHWPLAHLRENLSPTDRTFRSTMNAHIAVMDEHLDLATAAARMAKIVGKFPVPTTPPIVAGEGSHPDNHTLVKVLGPYGIAEQQFLAFPAKVRGGVRVECISGQIAATPAASTGTDSEVRIFDTDGILQHTITLPESGPLLLAAGDFTGGEGEELAIASVIGTSIYVFSPKGKEIARKEIAGSKITSLVADGGQLLAYSDENRQLSRIDLRSPDAIEQRTLDMLPPGRSVFPTVFDDELLWAGGAQQLRSHVFEIKADGSHIGKDVGRAENEFWLALPKEWEQDLGTFEGKAEARHIRLASYGHLRVDATSPRYSDPDFKGDPAPALRTVFQHSKLFHPLDQQSLKMWNPTFTHRMFPSRFRPWAEQIDPATGLNRYLQQNAEGGSDGYGQWDQPILISSTYAPSASLLQRQIYTHPLRVFLRGWVPQYRAQAWLAPSIEPNHEFESVVATGAGVGDYNPHMIRDFFEWLVLNYGDDPITWEHQFGVRLDQYFDAPRGQARASWDRYSPDNPWLLAWVEFNRYVVNRTLALSYREALIAGIPPEMIRSHQIPDRYAIAPLLNGLTRITPIDYATTAGVGFGFTKFGVNHTKTDGNIIQAAQTSGFDSFVMGEYQPLTLDPELAEKELRYVFSSGARAIHPLYWGASHTGGKTSPEDAQKNQTVYDSLQRLILEDPPRAGQAGGIGQVRPFVEQDGKRRFNIVSIGAGAEHRGLLKSVRSNGRMEGTVYVIPFHQHVTVTRIATDGRLIDQAIPPGSQIDLSGSAAGDVRVRIYRHGVELTDLGATLKGAFRYTVRFPGRCDGISVVAEAVGDGDLRIEDATLQVPQSADVHTGRHTGIPHRGGVLFDVFD